MHKWLLAHPRFVLHFTPTYSSWINQVERWFAEIQRRCLDRGVFCSLEELTIALQEWIKLWNDSAQPFKLPGKEPRATWQSMAAISGWPQRGV